MLKVNNTHVVFLILILIEISLVIFILELSMVDDIGYIVISVVSILLIFGINLLLSKTHDDKKEVNKWLYC